MRHLRKTGINKPNFKSYVQVEVVELAGHSDVKETIKRTYIVEDYGQTRLLSNKERLKVDNWVSIVASVVKDNGRYLVPDDGLTLKGLIKAAGYNRDKLAESYVTLHRSTRQGKVTTHLMYSRNLKTLFSGRESDIAIKPHDAVTGGYIEPSPNAEEFWSRYSFGDVIEMTVNDDGAKINMFADLDAGKLITPPDTLDNTDEKAVARWIKDNGIDVLGETANRVRGLVGFNMYAARVDNYFWDVDKLEITDRLLTSIDEPVLLSADNVLPVTYLIKTSEYKMGVLQILRFTENHRGIKIRYKLLDKGEIQKTDVQVEVEKPTIQVDVLTDKPAVVLDLDTGDKMQLDRGGDWPEEYDVAWDNDGGGAVFSKRGGSVTILPIYGVKDFEDAVRSPFSKTVEPGEEDRYGVFAKDSRYVWVKTSEGNIAVVEIQNYSPARAMLKWQIIKQNPDVEVVVEGLEVVPAPIVRAVDNKATLASGVSVELLGLTYVSLKDQPWWKPNGSVLEQPPFDNVSSDPSRDPNHDQFAYYAIAMRLNGKSPDKIGLIKWDFTDAVYAGTTSAYRGEKRVYAEGICAAAAKFPKDIETTTLRLGIASGDWQTLVAGRHYGFYRKGEDSIVVRTPERAGGPFGVRPKEKGLHISVTYNITDRDFRVVAVDKEGKVHFSSRGGSSGTDNLRRTTASFPDLTRDKLQEYRFQVRPHEWVEFKDISLRPGKEAVALTEKRRAAGREELEKWLGQGQTRRIREQILVLRGCRFFKEMEAWASAVRELVSIGKPAVPELLAELRRAQRWPTQSTVAFTLRAIADPRAVPVLIEVLGRVEYRGEYGIHLKDPPLSVFMLENQHRPAPDRGRKQKDPQITIGCPVIEITAALEKITGHTEGHEHYGHKAVAELGGDAPHKEWQQRVQEIVREVANRWQKWWDQNKDAVMSG